MILNINRKIILVIASLSVVTSLASLSGVLASIDYSDTAVEQSFRLLVTVTGMEGNCGEELKIIVAYKSDTFELCEGDERPSEEQRADPISSEGHEIVFPK
jgi:predicted RND superfamily exporter protein